MMELMAAGTWERGSSFHGLEPQVPGCGPELCLDTRTGRMTTTRVPLPENGQPVGMRHGKRRCQAGAQLSGTGRVLVTAGLLVAVLGTMYE